jgi:hypothetical protein
MKPMIAPLGASRSRSTMLSLRVPERLLAATGQVAGENAAAEAQIAFAASTSVRRLLDAISVSGVDLSDASSAEEIAEALTGLCRRGPEREG